LEGQVEGAGVDAVRVLLLNEATVDAGALLHPLADDHRQRTFLLREDVRLCAGEELIPRRCRREVGVPRRLLGVEEAGAPGERNAKAERDRRAVENSRHR
jgi:hypothetical protein